MQDHIEDFDRNRQNLVSTLTNGTMPSLCNHPNPTRTQTKIDPRLTSTLYNMSLFYMYAGPPPQGHGTPASNTADTILISGEFNRKRDENGSKCTLNVGTFQITDTRTQIKQKFTFNQTAKMFAQKLQQKCQ